MRTRAVAYGGFSQSMWDIARLTDAGKPAMCTGCTGARRQVEPFHMYPNSGNKAKSQHRVAS